MHPKTKIRVDRLALIDAIKEKAAEAQTAYEAELATYAGRVKTYNAAFLKVLIPEAREAAKGDQPIDLYDLRRSVKVDDNTPRPQEPRKPADSSRALQQLELSSEETINLSVEDFDRYL